MPLPKPKPDEERDAFLERCMGNPTMNRDYPDNKQRYRVCNEQWRDAKKSDTDEAGDAPPDEHKLAYKTYEAKLDFVEGERAVIAVVSTGIVDLEGEFLVPKGARFDRFRKAPSISWSHRYGELPVAKALWIKYDKGRDAIVAKPVYAETDFANDVYTLYLGGFLKSFSIAYDPSTAEIITPSDADLKRHSEWEGARRVIKTWDLVEFSCCTFGMNPEALVIAVNKGVVTADRLKSMGIEIPKSSEPTDPPEPVAPSDTPEPVRRVIIPAKRAIVRRSAWPKKKDLTDEIDVDNLVQREIDRLRGRCG